MRVGIVLGIIVALTLPLQGCGKKGALMLPAQQARTPDQPQAPAPVQGQQP